MRKSILVLVTVVIVFSSASITFGATASFQGLGDLPGGDFYSIASGISSDGSVVVGVSKSGSVDEAFRWTSGGGMVGLGDLPGGGLQTVAHGTSSDGSVVVGYGSSASGWEAFRWTSGGGMAGLGDLPGGSFDSRALDTSSDGSVVVGRGWSASGYEAFRWTSGGGMVGLGDLPGGKIQSIAVGISDDGSVVVGESYSTSGREAFRWTSGGGMVGLGDLPGGYFCSIVFDISADGSVVVGQSNSASGGEAFRWTSGGGMVGLGDLPGGSFSSLPHGTSSDGSVVVGQSNAVYGDEAFIWDETNGMQSLQNLLVNDFSLDLTGWQLTAAYGISSDGLTFAGYGTHNGNTEAWIATIPKPTIKVTVDIKPGSCPNPVNVKSRGVLPIAILGTEDVNVIDIVIASIRLADPNVAPIRNSYEDVAAPVFDANDCNCTTDGPDGFLDLTLKFETQRIVEAIGDVNHGDILTLMLTGVLFDETPIEGVDCILIRGKHKSLNKADINKDGVVDTVDFAIFAQNWLQSSIVDD